MNYPFIPILSTFLNSGLWEYFFIPMISLCFVAVVPCLLRYFFTLRGR